MYLYMCMCVCVYVCVFVHVFLESNLPLLDKPTNRLTSNAVLYICIYILYICIYIYIYI